MGTLATPTLKYVGLMAVQARTLSKMENQPYGVI